MSSFGSDSSFASYLSPDSAALNRLLEAELVLSGVAEKMTGHADLSVVVMSSTGVETDAVEQFDNICHEATLYTYNLRRKWLCPTLRPSWRLLLVKQGDRVRSGMLFRVVHVFGAITWKNSREARSVNAALPASETFKAERLIVLDILLLAVAEPWRYIKDEQPGGYGKLMNRAGTHVLEQMATATGARVMQKLARSSAHAVPWYTHANLSFVSEDAEASRLVQALARWESSPCTFSQHNLTVVVWTKALASVRDSGREVEAAGPPGAAAAAAAAARNASAGKRVATAVANAPPRKRPARAGVDGNMDMGTPGTPRSDEGAAAAAKPLPIAPNASTIRLTDGAALALTNKQQCEWMSNEGATLAAYRTWALNAFRHVGSFVLRLTPSNAEILDMAALAHQLGLHDRAVAPRLVPQRWRLKEKHPAFDLQCRADAVQRETWHKETGEVPGLGLVSPQCLLNAVHEGVLYCDHSKDIDALAAVLELARPSTELWGVPLITVSCEPPSELAAATPASQPPSKKQRKAVKQELTATCTQLVLTLHVYVNRLFFCRIANEDTHTLFNHLSCAPAANGAGSSTVSGGAIVDALTTLPKYAPCFKQSQVGAAAAPFTLKGLLKSCEHTGYRSTAQPAGLDLTLKPYQLQTLAWMLDMEALPRGINGLFWERRAFADGGFFYYSPALGEARLEEPPLMRGGLLCEEMGMGKTLEIVALIVAGRDAPPEAAPGLASSNTTLVIVPSHLLSQWGSEIRISVSDQRPLNVYTCDGHVLSAASIAGADVVLC